MKISKKNKGLVDYSDIYNPIIPADEYPEPEYSDEEIQVQWEMEDALRREREENAKALKEWEAQAKKNLEIILNVPGAIGDRLTYLLNAKDIERASFARQIGVGRTTIHRYISGQSIPNKKKLLLIIDALDMDVADFCYEPRDFKKWQAALEETIARKHDIFEFRDNLLDELSRNNFTYQHKGVTSRLPHRHYVILKAMLESSFRVLDLIAHDTKEWVPKEKTISEDADSVQEPSIEE